MRIAMVQMKNEGTICANLEKSLQRIAEAAENGADLVLFPEVQLTEFFPQYPGQDVSRYRIPLGSRIIREFQKAAESCQIMVVPNIYLEENGRAYDASLLIDAEGKILGIQKMIHVAQAHRFYEGDYYTPGDDGFQVFDTVYGKIGIVVCFDRHYPESIRTEALRGADLVLIPTVNTKEEPGEMFAWEIRVQAFQNSVACAMCNRAGEEGEMVFSGESLLTDASGKLIIIADDREQIVYGDVDLRDSAKVRASRPYTSLRRPEMYEE